MAGQPFGNRRIKSLRSRSRRRPVTLAVIGARHCRGCRQGKDEHDLFASIHTDTLPCGIRTDSRR